MAESDSRRISYLEQCFALLAPWEDVMMKTSSTHPGVDRFPSIEPTYFAFLAQMWLAKRKIGKAKMPIGDAAKFVVDLSPSRAGRFVSDAVSYGYLVEESDLRDKRKKYVYISPETEKRIDAAVDVSIFNFERAILEIPDHEK